jgi:hypothetical protein
VIEVRDRQSPLGRKAIVDALTRAAEERSASAGIFLSRTRQGLGREVGDWIEGECTAGPYVACTDEHLITAVRLLIAEDRIACLRVHAPEVDSAAISAQVQRIRVAVERVKTINTSLTSVRKSTDGIQSEAEALRDEIREALLTVEESLRSTPLSTLTSTAA